MMTLSNENIFRVTGHWCEEFTGHGWIPRTKASDVELDVFFDLRLKNGWVNNREAGDLRHHRAHYGIAVMLLHVSDGPSRHKCVYFVGSRHQSRLCIPRDFPYINTHMDNEEKQLKTHNFMAK